MLMSYIDDVTVSMPKSRKHTMGDELRRLTIGAMRSLYRANGAVSNPRVRVEAQEEMIYQLGTVRTLVRMCNEKKILSFSQVERITRHLDNIGRQVTAWRQKSAQKLSSQNARV